MEAALRDINAQQEEQRVLREVERKIVEAGYRAMATKSHPDVGGSHVDMEARFPARRF